MTEIKTAKFKLDGGVPLDGEIRIAGAKNAALPLLLCTLLTEERMVFNNIPDLTDVRTTLQLLQDLGKTYTFHVDRSWAEVAGSAFNSEASYDLVRIMRASIVALGPLLAYLGHAEVSLPGGCAIGSRPVDLHVKGLRALGAQIILEDGYIKATAPGGRLHGGHVIFDKVTVTGTENVMMAAALAEGQTVIENAALEPEVVDLAACLQQMGARISGAGTPRLEITGVRRLHGCEYSVVPDRIETGTFLLAAAVTHGRVCCLGTETQLLESLLAKLRAAGVRIDADGSMLTADARGIKLRPVDVVTAPYPGFPTDMQAQFTVLNALADGTSSVTETIFENRLMHVAELSRMGAHLKIRGNTVICAGVPGLTGAPVMASDLRAAACLVLAGLAAQGTTVVDRIYHMERGYACVEAKIRALGGRIERIY